MKFSKSVTILGTNVFVDDSIFSLLHMNATYPNAMVMDNQIWVTIALLEESNEMQEVMIAHELGHIHHKHSRKEHMVSDEIEADEYAISIMGKGTVFNVMKDVFSKIGHTGDTRSMSELIVRMIAIGE